MGKGPLRIVSNGLKQSGLAGIHVVEVPAEGKFPFEVGTTLRVARLLARAVRETVNQGGFPLVLAGGCMSSIGTLAGLGAPVGVLWLDAHGDFNTPETTVSGFFDGMALATATGRCWRSLAATIPGFEPVPESQVILLGARAFDPAERKLLARSAVTLIETSALRRTGVRGRLEPELKRLRAVTSKIYLHIDLDVLDVAEARVNQFSCAGGLTVTELLDVVRLARAHPSLAGLAITAYDPACDEGDKALQAALAIVALLDGSEESAVSLLDQLKSKRPNEA